MLVLHACWKEDKKSLNGMMSKVRKTLCDRNPSVMSAAVVMFHDMIKVDGRGPHKDLVPSFVSILKQVVEHRLPKGYDYHRIPAPWLQIRLMQVLQLLVAGDRDQSAHVYEMLTETARRADTGTSSGFAVLYECIRTATAMAPNTAVLDKLAPHIKTFLEGENNTHRCLGYACLAWLYARWPN